MSRRSQWLAVPLLLSIFGSVRAYVSDGDQLEEVTVTAQKRTESSQSVPMTIYTVSADERSKANIRNLFQLADLVPGMVFSRAPDDGMALTFRGIGSPVRSRRSSSRSACSSTAFSWPKRVCTPMPFSIWSEPK